MVSAILQERINILAGDLQGVAQDIHIYERLFDNKSLVPIRKKIAPRLFLRLAFALSNEIYAAMSRITDPAESLTRDGMRANISVARIQADIKSEGFPTRRVNKAASALCQTASSIRKYRSRRIAHTDDEFVRGDVSLAPEGGYPIGDVLTHSQEFLDAVMNAIGSRESYTVKHESYHKHAEALVYCLRFLEENWEEVEAGLQASNRRSYLDEFFSQTMFLKRDGNA